MTIYKYPIQPADVIRVQLPKRARLLRIDTQDGKLFLWAMVKAGREPEERIIRMAGTGHHVDDAHEDAPYINTLLLGGGIPVFHFFDVTP